MGGGPYPSLWSQVLSGGTLVLVQFLSRGDTPSPVTGPVQIKNPVPAPPWGGGGGTPARTGQQVPPWTGQGGGVPPSPDRAASNATPLAVKQEAVLV